MLWLNTSGRAASTVASASSSTSRKSGVSTSTEASRQLRLERPDRRREVARAAVGQVVAVDRGDDDVLEAHPRGGLREPERLERVGRPLRPAGVDVAVAARARAGVAEDLEGGRATAPALGDVRAARLLADRVQALAVDRARAPRSSGSPRSARAPSSTPAGAGARRRAATSHIATQSPDRASLSQVGCAEIFACTGCGQRPGAFLGGSSSSRARTRRRARRRRAAAPRRPRPAGRARAPSS